MKRSVRIFEPLYAEGQVLSEPAFAPYVLTDNSHAAWREFYILVEMYRCGVHLEQDATGLFSPKFSLKVRMGGDDALDFVQARPDADVWFFNPFPQLAYFSYNAWMQGEHAHPGLMARSQALLDACGIAWNLEQAPRQGPDLLCYCNFWVGTPAFWERYVGGVLVPIAEHLERFPASEAARGVLDPTVHSDAAPFLPFLTERLFSTFLSLDPSIRVAACPVPDARVMDYCTTDFERDLVRHMQRTVWQADRDLSFGAEQRALMDLMCGLWQRYLQAHFSVHPHPHTGKPIDFGQ